MHPLDKWILRWAFALASQACATEARRSELTDDGVTPGRWERYRDLNKIRIRIGHQVPV